MEIDPLLWLKIKTGGIVVNSRSPMEHKFWFKVDKSGPAHPEHGKCWVWTGAKMKGNGYGTIGGWNTKKLVHRYSFVLHNGPIINDLHVLHKCDNPACVNPKHLFLGSHQDNMADMKSKGRGIRGETQGGAKVTEEIVKEIKRRYERYSHTNGSGALAKEFGISLTQVWRIAMGKEWRHVV